MKKNMLQFIKHKFSRKDRMIARWGISHLLWALALGVVAAGGVLLWQTAKDNARVSELQQQASQVAAKAEPGDIIPPEAGGAIGGPFTLTSQDNKTVTDKDFAGKYLLVYFGYTSCPDMCPTGLESMSRAMDMLKTDADKVQPLFISIDPARDTPKKLKDYDSAFSPRIIGLTGTAAQIASVAKEYQVYYQKGEGDQDYEMEHSSVIYLLDPAGHLLATFQEEVEPKLIVEALHKVWAPLLNPNDTKHKT